MKQLTRQEVEAVVERLADMSISNGSLILCADIEDQLASYSLPDDKRTLPKNEWKWIIKEVIGDKFIYDREQIQVDNKLISDLHNIFYFCRFKNIGHPITIGTVLEKIDKTVGGRNYYAGQTTYNDELIHLWSRCGELTESLQQIVEASGWERVRLYAPLLSTTFEGEPVTKAPSIAIQDVEVLKSPEANALFSFLQEIV